MLTNAQQRLLEQLQQIALSSTIHFPNTLIYGPDGTGKRAILRSLADGFGLKLVEVNVSDSAEFVRRRLFGTPLERAPGTAIVVGGELGHDDEMVLFLSGFEMLCKELFQAIQRLLTNRTYVDLGGNEGRVGDGIWIIAGMRDWLDPPDRMSVNLDHWLCACFEHQLRLESPQDIKSIETVVGNILGEYGCWLEEPPDLALLEMVQNAPDCFRALRRWLATASRHRKVTGAVSKKNIRDAIVGDLESDFQRLRYRGHRLQTERFERWANQFGDLRSAAIQIVRWIARAYFISDREYFQGIEFLVQRSQIPRRSHVIFCKWQMEGQSGPRVANQIKNQAHWRVNPGEEIDLQRDEASWPKLDPNARHRIVLVDDFVGSGKTISRLFFGENAPIRRLLTKLPNARIWIGILIGFGPALQSALSAIGDSASRVTLTPYKLLAERDRCFSDSSRIFSDLAKKQVRNFCLDTAKKHYPKLPPSMRLGFNSTAALIVFHDTVPNNSLPIIWYDEGTWFPLFPASGLPQAE